MSPESRPLRGFSCPQESLDTAFMSRLATLHATELWRFFLAAHDFTPTAAGDRLDELTASSPAWLGEHADFETVWDRSFGLCHPAVSDHLEPAAVAAQVGLRLAAHGFEGGWRAAFDAPAALRFDDLLLPATAAIAVVAEKRRVTLELDGAGRVELCRRQAGWQLEQCSGERPRRLPSVQLGGHRIVLFFADSGLAGGVPAGAVPAARVDRTAIAETCRAAAAMLTEHAPEYATWVARVLRGIGPLRQRNKEIRSGSEIGWPGVVTLSFPCEPAALAEMLVHECSHQYFHQIRALGGVDDGSDDELHYSPVKQTGRPIRKILLAYHAFANVLLMYRRFLAGKVADDGYCQRNLDDLVPQLQQMESALRSTTALTASGRALFEPLAERVELTA